MAWNDFTHEPFTHASTEASYEHQKMPEFQLRNSFFSFVNFPKANFCFAGKIFAAYEKGPTIFKTAFDASTMSHNSREQLPQDKTDFYANFLIVIFGLAARLHSTQRNENLAQNLNFKWVLQCYIFVCRTDSTKHAVYTSTGIVDSGWWWPVWQLENWHPNFRELSQTIFKIDFFSLTLVVDGWWLSAL